MLEIMNRADRLLTLMHHIRVLPAPVTAGQLAEVLEVSPRTVYRDIDTLRASGALIDGSAGFGYTLAEDPLLPPLQFTEDEIEAFILGLSEVGERADHDLALAAQDARAKLIAALPERLRNRATYGVSKAVSLRTRPMPGVDPKILRHAAWNERVLKMKYIDGAEALTERVVWPLSISYLDDVDVLVAWCTLRKDHRVFRLDRILEVSETGISFRPRRASLYRDFLEKSEAEKKKRN